MIATTSLTPVNAGQIGTGQVGWGLHEAAIKAVASRRKRITAPFRIDRRDDPRGPQRDDDRRSFAGRAGTRLSTIGRFIWQWPRASRHASPHDARCRATTAGKSQKQQRNL
jgi:hypothetical protein